LAKEGGEGDGRHCSGVSAQTETSILKKILK